MNARRLRTLAAVSAVSALPWLFAGSGSADAPKVDAPKVDTKAIQGVWKGWAVEGKGENPDRGAIHVELQVTGDKIVAKDLGSGKSPDLGEGTYTLTVDGAGGTIDAVRTSSPGKGQTYKGIFKVEGDTWKWCTGAPNKARPAEFETKRGQFLLILKKSKA